MDQISQMDQRSGTGWPNKEADAQQPGDRTGVWQEGDEKLKLEDIFTQVEECIRHLEDPQVSLEDAFRFYEEGVRKLKTCNDKVAQIEQRMLVINGQGELEEF